MTRSTRLLLKAINSIPPSDRRRLSVTRLSIRTELSEKTVRTHLKKLQSEQLISAARPWTGIPYDITLHDKAADALKVS